MTRSSSFEKRIDALPVELVNDQDLRKRIVYLDAELEALITDEAHVDTQCYGAEQRQHFEKIAKEREEARSRRDTYVAELERRTP